MKNHNQTLETLKRRGGLAPEEAVAILKRQHWRSVSEMTMEEAVEFLEGYQREGDEYLRLRAIAEEAGHDGRGNDY